VQVGFEEKRGMGLCGWRETLVEPDQLVR